MPTKRAKPFFEFSHKFRIVAVHLDADPRNHSPSPSLSPFHHGILDGTVLDEMEIRDPADIPPLRWQKNRFRNKTDTIPANNFDHGCTTRGRGGGGGEDFTLE